MAFAYVDDYRNVSSWMFGISRFEPHGELEHGLGAVYDSTFQVPPVKLNSRVEITDWKQDELLELTSVKGFTNASVWRFEADGPERTRVSVVFSYQLPGGLAGKVMGKALEPIIAQSVRRSESNLRAGIEAAARAR